MSPMGIAASYWILAMALGVLGMLLILLAADGLVKGRGDPPSIIMGFFFGIAGLALLYVSLNGFWDFARGYTTTLDVLVKVWVKLAALMHHFWQAF
ncbi:MAG: hypothetical protein ABI743_06075 [bacterium]